MSSSPVRRPPYLVGVAIWAPLLAASLVLVAFAIRFVGIGIARDYRLAFVVAALAMLVGTVALSAWTGAAVSYQAWPSPRPPARAALVWRPPLAFRIGIVVSLVGASTAGVSVALIARLPSAFLLTGVAVLLLLWVAVSRLLIARLEADRWGIRCTNPLTTVRLPWADVRSLEARGESLLAQRIVAVSERGREWMLWVWDPRVPVTRGVARMLVAELEAVRRLATTPHANGIG